MVGEEFPIITNSQITDAGQTINTVQYVDIGIMLTVTPHINPDGLVIMDVYQEISDKTGKFVNITSSATSTVNAQEFSKRAAQSRVAIRDGQTIVIGGLMKDSNIDNVQKVPLLGDIPLLGHLFRWTSKDKIKTELLVFLTPHVAKVPEDLKSMSESEKAGTKAVRDAVEPGMFDEHMKGMERGAASPGEPDTAPVAPPPVAPPPSAVPTPQGAAATPEDQRGRRPPG
jgi:general secretion pathway protein D